MNNFSFSGRNQEKINDSVRKYNILICLVIHIIYGLFFGLTGFYDLLYLNIFFSIPVYIFAYYFSHKVNAITILVEFELIVHQLVCNTLLGNESGFYLILITVLFTSFIYKKWKKALIINLILTLSVMILSFGLSEMVTFKFNMDPFLLRVLLSLNITVLVFSVTSFFYYYIKQFDLSILNLNLLNQELQKLNFEIIDKNNKISEQNDTIATDNNLLSRQKDELTSTIDDLMLTRNYLADLNATKDKFFSIIAHDLRGPFVALLNNSELLETYYHKLDDAKKLKLISQLKNAATSTFSLLENLLLWAQSQKGSISFNPQAINLSDFVSKVINLLQSQAELKNIVINNQISDRTPVKADVEMLNTILRNLISNSIKFTSERGRIEIGIANIDATTDKHTSTIFIKDSGIGMGLSTLNKLFTIDNKISRKGTSGESGSGLGLILCKEFIETHGGKIWAESEERIGSTFYFQLPKITEQIKKIRQENKTLIENEDNDMEKKLKLNILIAEDDSLSAKLMAILMNDISKNTHLVRTGMEAVEFAKANPFLDLILMDIKMPGMNGYEATKQIHEFNKNIIIIAQTAFGLSGDKEKAIEAGCNDYISKPIKQEKLMIIIKRYFDDLWV